MPWIAKNSITGQEYGGVYKSIYDCQTFIDRYLKILEYEMQKCFALEKETIDSINGKSWVQSLQDSLNDLSKEISPMLNTIIDCTFFDNQKDVDEELRKLALSSWSSNNIIRCYETKQRRFADGFDF